MEQLGLLRRDYDGTCNELCRLHKDTCDELRSLRKEFVKLRRSLVLERSPSRFEASASFNAESDDSFTAATDDDAANATNDVPPHPDDAGPFPAAS